MTDKNSIHFYKKPLLALSLLLICWCNASYADNQDLSYQVDYVVELQPEHERVFVEMRVNSGKLLHRVEFDVTPGVISQVQANGKLTINQGRAKWVLPRAKARLTFYAKIPHERDPGEYDAMINRAWAIFRGDNVIPAMHVSFADNSVAKATLKFKLPVGWSVETGWPRIKGNRFRIDNPERAFDRPTGWMIAGKLGTRRNAIGNTDIAVSAPKGSKLRRMDTLTFLSFLWPQLQQVVTQTPDKLLIVGHGDPMWRGGLSGPNSLFLHADRDLVTEDGTSPLVHELIHMVTRIRGAKKIVAGKTVASDDWIAEGLAEFYSIELLYRAKGMPEARRNKIFKRLRARGQSVKNLQVARSHGDITARAVVLIDQLDKEIRTLSDDKYSIDEVTRELIKIRKVSLQDLREVTAQLIGPDIKALDTPLLRKNI